jgi:hypothetical protein
VDRESGSNLFYFAHFSRLFSRGAAAFRMGKSLPSPAPGKIMRSCLIAAAPAREKTSKKDCAIRRKTIPPTSLKEPA